MATVAFSHPASVDHGRPAYLAKLGLLLPCSVEDVKEAYIEKAKTAHPDAGGSTEQFIALQEAYERSLEFAEFHAGRTKWLARAVENYVEQEALIAWLKSVGGSAQLESRAWLRDEIGDDFAQIMDKLVGIRLNGSTVNDATIGALVEHKHLLTAVHSLDLSHSSVSDASLAALEALPALRPWIFRIPPRPMRACTLWNLSAACKPSAWPERARPCWAPIGCAAICRV